MPLLLHGSQITEKHFVVCCSEEYYRGRQQTSQVGSASHCLLAFLQRKIEQIGSHPQLKRFHQPHGSHVALAGLTSSFLAFFWHHKASTDSVTDFLRHEQHLKITVCSRPRGSVGIATSRTADGGSIPRWSARKSQDRRRAERQRAGTQKKIKTTVCNSIVSSYRARRMHVGNTHSFFYPLNGRGSLEHRSSH